MDKTLPVFPAVLAGGSGTRLWPISRQTLPKQFHAFGLQHTLLQSTILRHRELAKLQAPLLICGAEHRFLVAEQLAEIAVTGSIYLEPCARNTAPAIAVLAWSIVHNHGDGIMLVLPADHLIKNEAAYLQSLQAAIDHAHRGAVVTLGITPRHAATGYGYIQADSSPLPGEQAAAYGINKFVEKPSAAKAKAYLQDGAYFWNSGIFIFSASTYLEALKQYVPKIHATTRQAQAEIRMRHEFHRLGEASFAQSPSISIDYAVMEKIRGAIVIPSECQWSDLGSWQGLWEVSAKDDAGNSVSGDIRLSESVNNHILSEDRLVVAHGIENTVIVDTKDALLVTNKDAGEGMRGIMASLREDKRSETQSPSRVPRPWGSYEVLEVGTQFQVKRLTLKVGGKISLQSHQHRAEHWIVVQGKAQVRCGEEIFTLAANQSTYIPPLTLHQLENIGNEALQVIEVQTGAYLGEDDIHRVNDPY